MVSVMAVKRTGECITCKDMKKLGGAGRLKKACKQRICINTLPSHLDCASNTPPSISETITRLSSLADKYSSIVYTVINILSTRVAAFFSLLEHIQVTEYGCGLGVVY